ncbi:PilZ domain-containing protein [Halomonadaceae bacterium KBTZ08]
MASEERRFFSRILFDAQCEIHLGNRVWPSEVLDISLHGALLKAPPDFDGEEGDGYTIAIWLSDNTTRITMDAILRHKETDQLGFECRSLDLDSATHLRRLVELNLGDEAELHRELARLSDA